MTVDTASPARKIRAGSWGKAGEALVAKAIAEFAYEELLRPVADPSGYRLELPGAVYTFAAERGAFGSWRVSGVRRNEIPAADPLTFLTDTRDALGLDGPTAIEAIRELTATWAADARLLDGLPPAAQLAELGYAELESWQRGHPCMVLNKGRLGFTDSDAHRYSPEAGVTFRLPWLAVHRDLASRHGAELLEGELDSVTRERFGHALASRASQPGEYIWLPVHPYHLDACVRPMFAPYFADRRIVELGEGPDRYRPLASVRTLANVDHPHKHDVKLPLLIRNTLVWRGLAAAPTAAAPSVTGWLHRLRNGDPFLSGRLDLLGEVASVAAAHPLFASVADAPYRYHELLGAVWREPVGSYLRAGERARSLASLLGTGSDGRALAAELAARSGLEGHEWVRRLLQALLPGLLHALHAHGVAFCPHGENTIVVYDSSDVPVRIMLKDFAEDVNLLPDVDYDLPDSARDVLPRWPAGDLAHSILSALFAGHFRFFEAIAEEQLGVTGFWSLVRAQLDAYRARFPGLDHDGFGLTAPEIERICLNREHLTAGGFHDRAEKDESFDVTYGTVPNPLHEAVR